jgi:hypothetical protein
MAREPSTRTRWCKPIYYSRMVLEPILISTSMASRSSLSTSIPITFSILVVEKLSKTNYMLWHAQVMSAIRATHFDDLLLGKEKMSAKTVSDKVDDVVTEKPNPNYLNWVMRDQALLGYLFSLLTREVLQGITMLMTSASVWSTLEDMYSSHTRARSVNTHIALATTRKGTTTMADYYNKIKRHADEMAASGEPLGGEEFVAYVLTGLDEEIYNPLESSIVAHIDPISPSELYS